ncbi:MAG: peptide ABC transporter substrate-binding protein [Chlamydiota bacterium]
MKTLLSFFLCLLCIHPLFPSSQTLHISFATNPATLDPRKSGDYVTSTLMFMLYQGLTSLEKDGNLSMALAESIDISKDKKTYTFHIRKNCYWSDGREITAYDFEYSWKKILDPAFPALCAQLLYPIKNAEAAAKKKASLDDVKIKAIDAKTLLVELENPTPYFLSLTSFCVFFPVPNHSDQDTAKKTFSGPFRLVKWKQHNEILLKKNPHFWNKDTVILENIHISIIGDENTAYHMFEKGELDWIGTPTSPIPLDTLSTLKKSKEFLSFPVGATTFCAFNVEKPPLSNLFIRKALSLAINRQSIVNNVTQLGEIIATRYIPPITLKGLNRDLIEDNNIEKAQKYLQKGLTELHLQTQDLVITLTHNPSNLHKKLAEVLKEEWENALHIRVILQREEEKIWREHLYKHEFQVSLAQWILQYNDPLNIFERFKYKNHPKNYSNWESPAYISLINTIQTTSDSEERTQYILKAENFLHEEMPLTPIYHHKYSILIKPYLHNVEIGPMGDIHFEKAYIKKNL